MKNELKKMTTEIIKTEFVQEIQDIIKQARFQVAVSVNFVLTSLYWKIGKRILSETLNWERAEYGEQIVSTLSGQL